MYTQGVLSLHKQGIHAVNVDNSLQQHTLHVVNNPCTNKDVHMLNLYHRKVHMITLYHKVKVIPSDLACQCHKHLLYLD